MLYHQTVDQIITREIIDFTAGYCRRDNIATEFGKPLVGFADAMSPEIQNLTSVVSPDHLLPQDVMPEASIIISYFVPFTPELAAANNSAEPGIAAAQWARAYEELNALFTELNRHLVDLLPTLNSDPSGSSHSFRGAVVESATHFDTTKLISNWSHRHIAFAAGLIISLIISFVRDFLDVKIKHNEEMTTILGLPILAAIPDFEYFSNQKSSKKYGGYGYGK